MSANVPAQGAARQLDRTVEPEAQITTQEIANPERVVRLFARLLGDVAQLKRLWRARRLDYEGRTVLGDGTTRYRFEHLIGGSIRFWIVDWDGDDPPNLRRHASSDSSTLVLTSTSAGTMTLRIEEAG